MKILKIQEHKCPYCSANMIFDLKYTGHPSTAEDLPVQCDNCTGYSLCWYDSVKQGFVLTNTREVHYAMNPTTVYGAAD